MADLMGSEGRKKSIEFVSLDLLPDGDVTAVSPKNGMF